MYQPWIDGLKGWGIAFIVLGHIIGAGCHLSTGSTQVFCDLGYKYFYAFHVPLFFFVSGTTFKQRDWGAFLKGKFYRLLIPYFFFGLCSILIYEVFDQLAISILQGNETTTYYQGKAQEVSVLAQVSGLLLGGFGGSHCFIANAVLWFIPVLFTLEVTMQWIIRLSKSRWMLAVFGGLIFLFVAFYRHHLPRLPWGGDLVPIYIPFFILGKLWGYKSIPRCWWSIVLSILLMIGFGALAVINPYQYFPKTGWQYGITFLVTCGNIAAWTLMSNLWAWRGLVFLGHISLVVMFCHKFPVLFMQNFLSPIRQLFTKTIPLTLFATGMVFFVTIACCIGIYLILIRGCPWMIGHVNHTRNE